MWEYNTYVAGRLDVACGFDFLFYAQQMFWGILGITLRLPPSGAAAAFLDEEPLSEG